MRKNVIDSTIEIPKEEYKFLKELYRTVKRQNFLLRIDEAEKNLKAGKIKKVSIDKFIENIWEMKPKYVSYDKAFEKKFEKYKSKLTDGEKDKFRKRFEIFKENIFDKRLETHKLKGNLRDYYAFSIGFSNRVVFKLLDDCGVYFLEIGSHDVCYWILFSCNLVLYGKLLSKLR